VGTALSANWLRLVRGSHYTAGSLPARGVQFV